MIELSNVEVIRTGQKLFQDFSWTIASHEHWVITGANGSGKTWLLELLAGNLHAAKGTVTYDFIEGTTWDERYQQRKQRIHYIQAHAIQTFLQRHEIFYQQRYYSIGDERIPLVRDLFGEGIKRLHELNFPASLNIDSLLDLPVTRLSNGQLKKLVILKNLVLDLPKVLLFDYPFEGLDHTSRTDLVEFMDHLANAYGIQLILVDHEHHLPSVISKRLVLDNFSINRIEDVQPVPREKNITTPRQIVHNDGVPVVEMKDVTIRYGQKEIVSRLNWKIYKGQRWALTGRNGSGKTTLFSLIFADHPMAYSEQVFLFGKRRGSGESIWDIKNRINYLGPELITYLNPKGIIVPAREYIIQSLKKPDLAALDSAIVFFDAGSFLDQPVKYLSSGQLQLMLVIQSFLSDKELILLDEPFQFLDPVQKARVNQYLHQHLHEDTTLVLITHYEQDIIHWTEHRLSL